jgi:hypothetical protein
MRSLLLSALCLMFLVAGGGAEAKVAITVDKDNQQMTVAVDGVARYRWPVSTGIPSRETPAGNFRAFRMEEEHYSKEFDDAPMPHSIFFTKIGHAIHGTDSESRLGTPASHGCVRLSKANAATLYALVESEGVLNTTVTLTGSAQVALARNPRPRATDVARRDVAPQAPSYDAAGNPVDLTPQTQYPQQQYAPQQPYQAQQQYVPVDPYTGQPMYAQQPQYAPQQPSVPQPQYAPQPRRIITQQADDGYIYPADGSGGRYPAPRGFRRQYDAQAQQQYQADGSQVYQPQVYQPQVYQPQVYAPRPVYQPRGIY